MNVLKFNQRIFYSGKDKGASMFLYYTVADGGVILVDYFEDDQVYDSRRKLELDYFESLTLPSLALSRNKAIEYANNLKTGRV